MEIGADYVVIRRRGNAHVPLGRKAAIVEAVRVARKAGPGFYAVVAKVDRIVTTVLVSMPKGRRGSA